MAQKIIPIVSVLFITGLAVIFLFDSSSVQKDVLAETFFVNALYHEDSGIVEITFEDKSKKTTNVILEILGMQESYQKSFDGPSFVEKVDFGDPPKYGWAVNPVTFVIEHPELGSIGLKTEVHTINDPIPPIIYSTI